ncbi:DUF421 domain-containing protein [Shouchella shacheensis]|uniref:DUF421 domain-containing protein n=1 Tax=Shouchella shacheensis TaxID=1649580 RepID=UPI00073FCF5A|nr:YetF domain-containing protein [Shouchella shacheensis]
MNEIIEVAVRGVSVLIALWIIARLMPVKPAGQLSLLELLWLAGLVVVAGMGSVLLSIPASHVAVALFLWGGLPLFIYWLCRKSRTVAKLMMGRREEVARNGTFFEKVLTKKGITVDELLYKLASNHVFRLSDVESAVLERNGELTVEVKQDKRTPTPVTVIREGVIDHDALSSRGLSQQFLSTELEKQQVTLKNVYIGQVDEYGQLFIDVYNDQLSKEQPESELPLLWASLRRAQAELSAYSLQEEETSVKDMYTRCSHQLDEAIQEVKPLLKP